MVFVVGDERRTNYPALEQASAAMYNLTVQRGGVVAQEVLGLRLGHEPEQFFMQVVFLLRRRTGQVAKIAGYAIPYCRLLPCLHGSPVEALRECYKDLDTLGMQKMAPYNQKTNTKCHIFSFFTSLHEPHAVQERRSYHSAPLRCVVRLAGPLPRGRKFRSPSPKDSAAYHARPGRDAASTSAR